MLPANFDAERPTPQRPPQHVFRARRLTPHAPRALEQQRTQIPRQCRKRRRRGLGHALHPRKNHDSAPPRSSPTHARWQDSSALGMIQPAPPQRPDSVKPPR